MNEQKGSEPNNTLNEIRENPNLSQQEKKDLVLAYHRNQHTTAANNFLKLNKSDENTIEPDCLHYQRGCLIECPDCKKFVRCRLCHDAVIGDHALNRFKVCFVKCCECGEICSVGQDDKEQRCRECNNLFGTYYCHVCHLYDNSARDIFHCDQCGMCRVGKSENFKHCSKCDLCIGVALFETHQCFANTWNDCPVCMEPMKDSTKSLYLLNCGHGMHLECVRHLLESDYRCSLCKKSIVIMTDVWNQIRNDIANSGVNITFTNETGTILEKEYLCNDCGSLFKASKNLFNMQECKNCGSFNSS